MNDDRATDVRAFLHEFADEGRPVDLAVAALRAGNRRIRVRRAAVTGLAVIAAFVAIAVPYQLLASQRTALVPGGSTTASSQPGPAASGDGDPGAPTPAQAPAASISPTPAGPLPTSGPLRLPGGLIVLAGRSADTTTRIYDRAGGRYRTVTARRTSPSPRGTLVLEVSETGELTVRDLTTDRAKPLDVRGGIGGEFGATWSADGRYLAVNSLEKSSGRQQIVIVDAVRGAVEHGYPLDSQAYRCGEYCALSWNPDGTAVGLTLTDQTAAHDESKPDRQRGVQYFAVSTGAPARFVAVPGWIPGPHSWSPDGRYVVIASGWGRSLIVEVAGGKALQPERGVGADQVWWTDDGRPVAVADGRATYFDLSGNVTDVVTLPAEVASGTVILARP